MNQNLKGTKFHVKNQDYFGTMATVLCLVEQSVKKSEKKAWSIQALKNVEESLLHLQKNCEIVEIGKIKNSKLIR